MKIAILGLGLIGGSFSKALKKYTNHEISGYDIDKGVMKRALEDGAIDAPLKKEDLKDMDLLFLALRPRAAINFVKENADINNYLIDLCGVKREVEREILPLSIERGFSYIGGHPMAGRERGGYENSSYDLFKNASMILIPHADIPEWIEITFYDIGFSNIEISTAEKHDKMIAFTSQLAHIVSSAYVKSPQALDHRGYSSGSLKDMSRVAFLDVDMWAELFMANRDNLAEEISTIISHLEEYKGAIEKGDEDSLRELLGLGLERRIAMFEEDI